MVINVLSKSFSRSLRHSTRTDKNLFHVYTLSAGERKKQKRKQNAIHPVDAIEKKKAWRWNFNFLKAPVDYIV